MQQCDNCGYSYANGLHGRIACGAPAEESDGRRPIWSARKYSESALLVVLLTGKPSKDADCDNLAADDGKTCRTWRVKQPVTQEA